MTTVEFVENYAPYVKGDVATFVEEEAEKLIEAKVAVKVSKKVETKEVKPSK